MDADKLKLVLEKHAEWILDNEVGECANLSGANLTCAYLRGAYLTCADLRGANLTCADLSGANLRGANGILSIGPGGSRGDMLYAVLHDTCVMVKAGCWWGTLDEFAIRVQEVHGDNKHGQYYRACIETIKVWEQGAR